MPPLKKKKIEDAVGTMLAHDMTRIVPGKFKGVGFKKGHLIKKEDIPELLKIGKKHVYILELSDDELHEDDAALRIAGAIAGEHLRWTDPSEGKSTIYDVVLPRVLSGEKITRDEIADMGHGGFCMNCEPCRFPDCFFGK